MCFCSEDQKKSSQLSYVFITDVAEDIYERGFRVLEFNIILEDVFGIGP